MPSSANPVHVGLVVDGVRRWARQRNVPLAEAYRSAMLRVLTVGNFFFHRGTQSLSVYLLSKDNLARPPADLQAALEGETLFLRDDLPCFQAKWECAVRHAGTASLLPRSYDDALVQLASKHHNASRTLFVLAAYDPWDELAAALARDEGELMKSLWVPEPLDLIIRTSGERRLSGFLPLQSAYAELCFLRKHVNDLTTQDCGRALRWYLKRHRRFGH